MGRDCLTVVRAIAEHLPRWTAQPSPYGHDQQLAELAHASGPRVHVRLDDGRLYMVGCGPQLSDGTYLPSTGWRLLEITVDASRDPERIARDVRTRLLIPYVDAYIAAKSRTDVVNNRGAEARLVADRIAAAIGGERVVDRGWRDTRSPLAEVFISGGPVNRLRVSPSSDGVAVSFEVHGMDPSTALAVLELIKAAEVSAETVAARIETVSADAEELEIEEPAERVARRVA